jgi:hypothetical protein
MVNMTAQELRAMIREQMQHEDELVNHRLNWLLVLQGFLFFAFMQVLTIEDKLPHPILTLLVVALFGIAISFFVALSIRGAIRAVEELERFWDSTDLVTQEAKEKLPPISYLGRWDKAEVAAYGIPGCIVIAWIILLVIAAQV